MSDNIWNDYTQTVKSLMSNVLSTACEKADLSLIKNSTELVGELIDVSEELESLISRDFTSAKNRIDLLLRYGDAYRILASMGVLGKKTNNSKIENLASNALSLLLALVSTCLAVPIKEVST